MDTVVDVMVSFAQLTDAVLKNAAVRESEEARAVLAEACRFYEAASREDRVQLRRLLPPEIRTQLIKHFIPHIVASFTETGDPAELRLALVALSLDDRGGDFYKSRLYLRSLYLSAMRYQIDPMHFFREVAAISNTTDYVMRGGLRATWHDSLPLQLYLTFFENSIFFQDEVKPYISND